jgi:hypothetical protein
MAGNMQALQIIGIVAMVVILAAVTPAIWWQLSITGLGILAFMQLVPIPVNKQVSSLIIVIGLAALLLTGGIGEISSMFVSATVGGTVQTQTITTADGTVIITAAACEVSEELAGKASTITFDPIDIQSGSSDSLGSIQAAVFNGATGTRISAGSTAAGSVTGVVVGQVVDIYPGIGNNSYYGDPVFDWCIRTEKETVPINMHAVQTEANMAINTLDKNSNALTTGTTGEEDDEIILGAEEKAKVFLELTNNNVDAAYDHCGWAIRVANDIESFEPEAGKTSYHIESAAKWLKVNIAVNDTNAVNISKYDEVWVDQINPTRLRQWQFVKDPFIIEGGATAPAARDAGDSDADSDVAIALSLDCDYALPLDTGRPIYDYYKHNDAQTDVGLAQTATSPYGALTGVVIEGKAS